MLRAVLPEMERGKQVRRINNSCSKAHLVFSLGRRAPVREKWSKQFGMRFIERNMVLAGWE